MSIGCCTARASCSTSWRSVSRKSRIRARYGASLPSLPSFSRNADAHLARLRVSGTLRARERLSEKTADLYYDTIAAKLQTPEFLPRALYERFNLEVLATTDSPLDTLTDHAAIRESGWKARIIPNFRPDSGGRSRVSGLRRIGRATRRADWENTATWQGYLNALRKTRDRFREFGCTATDHGHPTAQTADLAKADAVNLFGVCSEARPMPSSRKRSARKCSKRWHA